MKFSLNLVVVGTLVTSTLANPFAALQSANYTLGNPDCVFDFSDLEGYEVNCTTPISTPLDVTISLLSYVEGGDCEQDPIPALNGAIDTGPNGTGYSDRIASNAFVYIDFRSIPDSEPGVPAIVEFCITQELYLGIQGDVGTMKMYYVKTPILTEFNYDGTYEVSAGVSINDAVGDKIENEIIFRAYAEVCDSETKQKTTASLSLGDVLYVCVRPWANQTTTELQDVETFVIKKSGTIGDISMAAVIVKAPNAVTAVIGKGSRLITIGIRVPAIFFDSDTNIIGNGEVIIVQSRRLLRVGIDNGRRLEEEAVSDGAFDLSIGISSLEPLSGSVLSSKSSKMVLSMAFVVLGALYCFR